MAGRVAGWVSLVNGPGDGKKKLRGKDEDHFGKSPGVLRRSEHGDREP